MVMEIGAIVSGVGSFASVFWIFWVLESWRHRAGTLWLEEQTADPPANGRGWPSLALVLAARNEAGGVERAVRSMLAQDYPGLTLIAVDDRSTDDTGPILDRLAAEDERLRIVPIRALPAGWLGKSHALQLAAESSAAEWFLFTDADVILAPKVLRRAVGLAVREGIDHLFAAPDTINESEPERIFMSMFALMFAIHAPPWRVLDPSRRAAAGIGAFNLVRADAFRAVGGYRHISLSIDDDMRLGQALKFAGYRSRVVMGRNAVAVRWQVGLWGMVRGLEKNFFAGLDFRLAAVALGVPAILILGLGPHLGVFFGPWWSRATCAAGIGAIAISLARERRQGGIAWYHALFLPLGAAACALALIRSTWITLRQGGVRWRDHLYPLNELKEHVRRRNAWAREVWRSTR